MSAPRKTRTMPRWRKRHSRCGTTGGYTCKGPNCQASTGKTARQYRAGGAADSK